MNSNNSDAKGSLRDGREKYSHPRLVLPFSDGVYLAVNAVPDLALIADGIDCYLSKSERVQPNHDWQSTLHSVPEPRVFVSDCGLEEQAMGDTSKIEETLVRVAQEGRFGGIALVAQSSIELTDRDYDDILAELAPEIGVPVLDLTQGELTKDWIDGYAATLAELAHRIELPDVTDQPDDAVAVVGLLMDRNEGDAWGNLEQLGLLCRGLGLDAVSVWPSGRPCSDLAQVAAASTIVSLPYGREAARVLAERTSSRLVEAPLPVGFDGCAAFLRAIGSALDRDEQAERLISENERRVLPLLRIPTARWFAGRDFAFIGDPYLAEPVCGLLRFLGASPALVLSTALGDKSTVDVADVSLRFDFVISYGGYEGEIDAPIVELGYPSYRTHHLLPMPFMGYDGILGLVERLANGLSHFSDIVRR